MKILHRSKRALPPLPQVAELINKLSDTPNEDLHEVLGQIDSWKWPRSDLNAWIKVLNKFDAILEEVIQDYDIDKLQVNVFTPMTKKTVSEILRFERLLLENSTNRKTYASYDRINSLLSTSDLDILILALNLLLRPAQQYSAQPAVTRALSISTHRLQSLGKRWSNLREYDVTLVDLVTDHGRPVLEALPIEAREVQFKFYNTGKAKRPKDRANEMEVDLPETSQPSPQRPLAPVSTASSSQTAGAITLYFDTQTLSSKGAMDILADCIDTYNVPEEERFELMCRIRAAQALLPGREEDRERLVVARLLATAIFVHTHPEAQTASALFLYEPDLIPHVAELLALDRNVPIGIQTAAVATLDAVARYRTKVQDVLAAVNAGVNHGTLMALLRKTVAEVATPESTLPHSFVEALLSFVIFLASHAAGGNMVVGAGLIPLLIQIIENRLPQRLAVVSKTMQLVDNVLYSFGNAFQLFCNNRGVEVLVERIEYEVDEDIRTLGQLELPNDIPRSYGQLPVVRAAALKHILRSMHRMMQSSGTAEGLRGLIDSSLLKSIKKIIEHRSLFGPNVLPIAINILATFVHNEPTSLTVIQEAGVPEAFYRAVEAGLEPVIEVIQAIPNAIGALCLNQAGQDQLITRPTIIPGLFSIFTSERHQRVLQDKENAVLIGSAVDELIRHHPSLKSAVFEAIKSTLSKIEDLGNTFTPSESNESWYKLVRTTATASVPADEDVLMRSSDTAPIDEATSESTGRPNALIVSLTDDLLDENATGRSHENIIISYLDVICRFLEGLFQHTSHCKDFISNSDSLVLLGRLTALPCIPYDFGGSVASDSLVQVIRTMFDAAPNATMNSLTSWVKESLQETSAFWSPLGRESRFIELLDLADQSHSDANRTFRTLITLLVRVILLSDIHATAGYAHGRSAGGLLQTLMSTGASEILPDLGVLHRACIWENVLLKAQIPEKESELEGNALLSSLQAPGEPSSSEPAIAANGANTSSVTVTPTGISGQGSRESDPREENTKAFRHLANQIPGALSPFFQSIVKLFSTRRNPDATQKQQVLESASIVANVLLKHLEPMESEDPTESLSISSCYTSLLGLVTTLMLDERPAQNTLYTVLLDAFYRKGGLDAIVTICRSFICTISEHSQTRTEDRTEVANQDQALGHAYSGIKVALHLLHSLTSSKPIFESSQTVLLLTRDKKDTDPDYFEPHNFLVKTRLAVLPIVRDLWEAPWLVSSPQSLIKSVVQAVLEILNGDGEENPPDISPHTVPGASSLSMGGPSLFRVTVPDENRIRQLTDMGFSRPGAERALIRTHNNVNAATELLLSNPFRFQNDSEPVAPQSQEAGGSSEASGDAPPTAVEAPPSGSTSIQDDVAPPSPDDQLAVEADSRPPGKSADEWRNELNTMREPLKSEVGRLALRLVDEHPDLIFDVHNAFVGRDDGYQRSSVRLLIDDIPSFAEISQDREQHLAVRCRLLALVLNEAPASFAATVMGDEQDFMDVVLTLLLTFSIDTAAKQTTIPKWLAALMLVAEALLSLSEDPRSIILPKEGDPIVAQEILTGPAYDKARAVLFDFSLRLLALPDLPRDELLASLRLLVFMTRDHDLAMQFVKRDGVPLLFKSLKSSSGGVAGSQSYVSIMLRHIVEDPVVLRHIMREEVQRFFSHPRTRTVDATGYVRACNALALRDPKAFIDITKSLAQLERPFAYLSQILPKEQDSQEGGTSSGESGKEPKPHSGSQAEIAAHTLPSPPEYFEAVVHFLVGELVEVVRSSSRPSEGASNSESTSPEASFAEGGVRHPSQPERKPASEAQDSKPDHYYSGFLMQSLTELMFSYDACKTAFLSYSPSKRSGIAPKDATKGRLTALNFVLSDLVSFRTIDLDPGSDSRNKVPLCNWAMSLIVALCVDTSSSQPIKDVSPELIAVRKTVLEAVSRAIKDPSQSESLDARYGRLLALADLCYRLLTVRFNPGLRKPHEETPTHIAKIMLEKNFVSTLTNALAEVDLNYPNVRVVVAAMLKPLELLSKIAIKMNRASDRVKSSEESKDEMDQESLPEEDEMEDGQDTAREETPDLYRNSSLGMFGGDMEEQFATEDIIDAEHGDEEEDVEMDFGEETGGSEGTSATDEDEEPDDPDDEEGDSEEDWHDEDEDEDLLEEDEENRAPEADGQVDPDVDVDGVWEGVGMEDGAPDVDADEGDEEIAVPIYHHDTEEAEADLESDEELEGELGFDPQDDGPSIGDVLGFEGAVTDGFPGFIEAHDGGLIISGSSRARRGRIDDDDIGILGRSRSTGASADATTHPLLLEATGNPGRHIPDIGRAVRRSQRILASGGHQDLLQAIEDIIGGGAVQLFQHIVNPRGGVADTIRLDVPPGTLVNLDRGLFPRRGGVSASLRIDQPPRSVSVRPEGRDFDPFPTVQRWSEEAKVIHGKFAPDRFAKLGNHVVLALLPAAVEKAEAAKEAKEAAEREEAQRREAAAQADESANKTAEAASQIPSPPAIPLEALEPEPGPEPEPEPEPESASSSVPPAPAPPVTSETDTEMLDATAESSSANEQDTADDDTGTPEATTDQDQEGSGEPGPTSGPERITVSIHGSAVDITDTGIDPTFLEALPDDMREEVVNQHIRDQQAARMERPPDSQISAEFLDALPPEIRAEILHQERIEQARRRAEERTTAGTAGTAEAGDGAGAGAGAVAAPVDMDPASFIASLDPQLRQDVLMDQDEGFIQTLPSHIIAEAGSFRERAPRRIPPVIPGSRAEGNTNAAITRKPQAPRDAIQLLDKSGVAVLVRLLFFPQISRKNILYKTLVNLCENSKTRAELFNFLLNILQEGTGDLAAIDRSFTQMTIRNSKGPAQLHRPTGKQKTGPEYLSSLPTHNSPSEVVPDLIAQRCLEALSYIVTSNESSSLFFLTEQEMTVGLRRHSSKKGKGKEKQAAQTQYPIVLLLSLLDRQPLLKTPSVLELVVSLLDTVTRPLTGLKIPQKSEAAAVSTAPQTQPSEEAPSDLRAPLADQSNPAPPHPLQESQKEAPRPDAVEEKTLLIDPPLVPTSALRSIVNILTVGDCGAKPFHHTLSLIQHLSFIQDTRDVVAQELRSKAQEFGQSLYHDLDELANSLQGQGDDVFTSSVASKFSSPASDQAKLLRVLKTIDYMFSPKATISPEPQPTTDLEKIQGIYESFRFTPLWRRLGDCLSIIEQRSEIEHIATVLLPLIEALMVVCKYVGSASITAGPSRMLRASASPRSPTSPREAMEDLFVSFTDAHRKVLNVMVRNNPSLMSGSFSLLVNNPRVLDFDNKRNYFNQQLHKRPHSREHHGTLQLNVRRQRVFEDSFQSLQRKTGDQIKYGKLSVRFYDEEGVDAGGVTREWFQILARQMFDPNNALFQPCAADRLTYQPSKASWVNPEHLSFFKFVGRVIGKAIYDGRLLDAYFARSLYRQILGKPVDYRDVEWIDPEYYNSLCWILENDPSPLDLTFSVEGDEFGVTKIVSLKENGVSIPVTLENQREFVQLSAQYRLYTSIKDQLENLLSGFYEIIPKDLIAIFNEKELELLISGTPDIDVDEWRSATEYNGYTGSDPVIVWWWRALKSFNRDERAKVLSFATGTSRVPLGGFNDLQGVQGTQRFSIHRAYGDPDRLPQAHTCFNQIDLPQYSSYEMLRQQLLLSINEGGEGFGFA